MNTVLDHLFEDIIILKPKKPESDKTTKKKILNDNYYKNNREKILAKKREYNHNRRKFNDFLQFQLRILVSDVQVFCPKTCIRLLNKINKTSYIFTFHVSKAR